MLLKLSLPEGKVVWATAHPGSREYIHEDNGTGYQDSSIIVTAQNQPVEVNLENYPRWASTQILSSVRRGELINTGDPITEIKPKETEDKVTLEVEQPKVTKKKVTKKKAKTSKKKQTNKE